VVVASRKPRVRMRHVKETGMVVASRKPRVRMRHVEKLAWW
jgi:hypothetical protein